MNFLIWGAAILAACCGPDASASIRVVSEGHSCPPLTFLISLEPCGALVDLDGCDITSEELPGLMRVLPKNAVSHVKVVLANKDKTSVQAIALCLWRLWNAADPRTKTIIFASVL